MYKELIISVIIIILIFLLDFITQKYTDIATNETIKDISKINEKIKNAKYEKIKEETNDLYSKWLKKHEILAFFIEHNELEKVESNYVTGKSYIELKQYENAYAELEETVYILQHINDKYSFNLANIF